MRATGKSIWLKGFRRAWNQLTIARGEAEGNSQLFSGPTESRELDGFFCWPRDHSLFVLLYHYMPTVNKIATYRPDISRAYQVCNYWSAMALD